MENADKLLKGYNKLKDAFIDTLTKNDQIVDDPYYTLNDRSGIVKSRRDIAKDIEEENEFGIKMITLLMALSCDLLARQKLAWRDIEHDEKII